MAGEPFAVVLEVASDGPDEHGPQAEAAEAEGDVGGDAALADVQFVDQEGERHVVERVRHELFGEPAREVHQMVGGDGTCDRCAHLTPPPTSGAPPRDPCAPR